MATLKTAERERSVVVAAILAVGIAGAPGIVIVVVIAVISALAVAAAVASAVASLSTAVVPSPSREAESFLMTS
ncbi:hypothetical protein ARSEF4850_008387 [Beauveria asiatica]